MARHSPLGAGGSCHVGSGCAFSPLLLRPQCRGGLRGPTSPAFPAGTTAGRNSSMSWRSSVRSERCRSMAWTPRAGESMSNPTQVITTSRQAWADPFLPASWGSRWAWGLPLSPSAASYTSASRAAPVSECPHQGHLGPEECIAARPVVATLVDGLVGRSNCTSLVCPLQAPPQTSRCTQPWWSPTAASWAWTCPTGAT